jgi:hypothetical protein
MYGRIPVAFQLPKVRRLIGSFASNCFSSMKARSPLAFSVKSFMPPISAHLAGNNYRAVFVGPYGNYSSGGSGARARSSATVISHHLFFTFPSVRVNYSMPLLLFR